MNKLGLKQKDLEYLASMDSVSTTAYKKKKFIIYYRDDFVDEVITDNVKYLEDYVSGVVKEAYNHPEDVDIRDEEGGLDFTFKILIDKPSEVYKRIFK